MKILVATILWVGCATSVFASIEYGGLTFYQSTPEDMPKVPGDFRGCEVDKTAPPNDPTARTRCTVLFTRGDSKASSLTQEFVFQRGVLQAVKITASDERTYDELSAQLSKQFAAARPPVVASNPKAMRIVIAEQKPLSLAGRTDVVAPKVLERWQPSYPESVRNLRVEGDVVVQAVVGADGTVQDPRVVRSLNPILDQAALQAVRQWKYEPATLDGDPVAVYLTMTATFSLHGRPAPRLHAVASVMPHGIFVTCNLPCNAWVDGQAKGALKANHGTLIEASAGKHDLKIENADNSKDRELATVVVAGE